MASPNQPSQVAKRSRAENNPPCPFCGGKTTGKPEEPNRNDAGLYERVRRYTCESDSSHRFKTVESVKDPPLLVLKSSGARTEPFERDKILRGIKLAAYMLCSDQDQKPCLDLVDKAVRHLLDHKKTVNGHDSKLGRIYRSSDIGESVLYVLFEHAPVAAWMRYALKFYGKDAITDKDSFDDILAMLHEKYAEFGRGQP